MSQTRRKSILSVGDFLVLGVLGLVNRGVLDYKIIVIDCEEAREKQIETLACYERKERSNLDRIREWFRLECEFEKERYGSKFMWDGQIKNLDLAMDVIEEKQVQYEALLDIPEISAEKGIWVPAQHH